MPVITVDGKDSFTLQICRKVTATNTRTLIGPWSSAAAETAPVQHPQGCECSFCVPLQRTSCVLPALRSEFSVTTKAALKNTPESGLFAHSFLFATELIQCIVEYAVLDSHSGAFVRSGCEMCVMQSAFDRGCRAKHSSTVCAAASSNFAPRQILIERQKCTPLLLEWTAMLSTGSLSPRSAAPLWVPWPPPIPQPLRTRVPKCSLRPMVLPNSPSIRQLGVSF